MVHWDYEKLPSCGHLFLFGILLPLLSFLWLAIGRRNNIFRQETLPLIHFCLLQHTSQEDAFTQNERFKFRIACLTASSSKAIAESNVSGAGQLPLFQ